MPINVMIGILALLVALVLYSIAVFGAMRAKNVTRTHVILIAVGFVFDVLATASMAWSNGGLALTPFSALVHTLLAFVAMLGMLAVGVLGWRAVSSEDRNLGAAIAKWAIAPWILWVALFVWGMASGGPQG